MEHLGGNFEVQATLDLKGRFLAVDIASCCPLIKGTAKVRA